MISGLRSGNTLRDSDLAGDTFAGFGWASFSSGLMRLTSRLRSFGPSCDHAAHRVPTVRENQNDVRYDKSDEEAHQPEMPDPRPVESAQERRKPGKLHGFVNPPAGDNRQPTGDGN